MKAQPATSLYTTAITQAEILHAALARQGILLRRFATESAREEARMFCDELVAEEAIPPVGHDLIAA
jgi:hypothetical protein